MITFNKIENGNIFASDFSSFANNNIIEFTASTEEIAVIYGPNGTGKTSFINVLSSTKGTNLEFQYEGTTYTRGDNIFHIISDQNNRNIIVGETKDFVLGDNIKREYELQTLIASDREKISNETISLLKSSYEISAANSLLISFIDNPVIADFIKDLANKSSRGKKYSDEKFISVFNENVIVTLPQFTDSKLQFLKNDYIKSDSIIAQIEGIVSKAMQSNSLVLQIEENSEAINILKRFKKNQCIVCDTEEIDWESLLIKKTETRTAAYDALDEDVRVIVEKIINLIPANDPFEIKRLLLEAIDSGDKANIYALIEEVNAYKKLYNQLVLNDLKEIFSKSELPILLVEYNTLVSRKPEITEEDLLYIQEIISNSMDKPISLERDASLNLKIKLQGQDFLNKGREEIPLSAGEQNFLSLTFEFLKAKNSPCPFIVIDDPISSFDSIYKNKVVYAIVKMLHQKKRIVLTHSTDLLRLLENQYNNCYKLYLLNNTSGEENGFISLKSNERDLITNLKKLLSTFRTCIFTHIKDVNFFLIAMIPFMRGYANIIGKEEIFEELTKLMHGYRSEKSDIAKVYTELFGNIDNIIPVSYELSVSDILSKTLDGVSILDRDKYPLLDKTLRHSFTYLFLRLLVEKRLVEKFGIDTAQYKKLGQIIAAAYPDETDNEQIKNRVKLTSKKTLLNEFNHFEGNLSILYPAIDITDNALEKERVEILDFVNKL